MTPGPKGAELVPLARKFLEAGKLAEAEKAALAALEAAPRSDQIRLLLALIKMRMGDLGAAEKWATRSLQLLPTDHNSLSFQAEFSWRTGNSELAMKTAEKLVSLYPQDAFGWNNLGFFNTSAERHDRAAICYATAASKLPTFAPFHQNLGNAFAMQDKAREAITALGRAVELDSNNFESWSLLATQQLFVGEMRKASSSCNRAFALEPETPRGLLEGAKARIYESANLNEAEGFLTRAIKKEPGNAEAYAHMGFVCQKLGRTEESTECLLKAIALKPNSAGAYADLLSGKKVTPDDIPIVRKLAELRDLPTSTAYDQRLISFTLGKAYNELGRYGDAMAACDDAHRIERDVFGKGFDREGYRLANDLLIQLFDKDPATFSDWPHFSTVKPIFIVGMMRSGTTLVEQILSSQSQVAAAGELGFWAWNLFDAIDLKSSQIRRDRCADLAKEYLDSLEEIGKGAPRVTDKLPENYRSLGLLRMLFPNAKFIHCRRNPVDTCVSAYMQPFLSPPPYVHSKEDLAFAYREYERLTQHWRSILPHDAIFEVHYHEMVAEPERVSRELISYCGLEWEEACLKPELNLRAVFTASHWQVRQPVYSSSVGRWRRYEPWLGPLSQLQ